MTNNLSREPAPRTDGRRPALPALAIAAGLLLWVASARAEEVLVAAGSPLRYLANRSDPGLGLSWTAPAFVDSSWQAGVYGVGFETATGAQGLIRTAVPSGTSSIYTRCPFDITDVSRIASLHLGADYDDGFVAWLNGVEVYRSVEMGSAAPAWNSAPGSHESSNGSTPDYGALHDISAAAIPLLQVGANVLAVGVWNSTASSSDLVLVPRLVEGVPAGSPPGSIAVVRGPYLQTGSPTGVVVRWRTDTPCQGVVRFGPAPGSLTASAAEASPGTEHEVALSGLAPETRYHYAIGTPGETLRGGDDDHFFLTPPPTGKAKPTRIWVLGDSGTADASARAVRDAYYRFAGGRHTDLWLMLGDNAYPDGTDAEHQRAVFDMFPEMLRRSVLWSTLGNHDGITADSGTQSGPYYDIFSLPTAGQAGGVASGTEAYYSFDHGDIHFVCLDSYDSDRSPGGAMLSWLREDLAATGQRWIIAFWHHPPYSKGSHNSDTEVELVEMRKHALPILEAGGVDLVLSGHSHSYERSILLDGHYGTSGTLSASMKRDPGDGRIDGDGAYEKPSAGPAPHEGAVYVVAGSSGKVSGGSLNHPAMYISLNLMGSLVIDIDQNQMDVRFLDPAGVFRDHFTQRKGPAEPNPPPRPPTNLRVTLVPAGG